jgi:hypothetical protein
MALGAEPAKRPEVERPYAVDSIEGIDAMPPALQDYLRERRRAIITELRKIEAMLGMEQSVPERRRPH